MAHTFFKSIAGYLIFSCSFVLLTCLLTPAFFPQSASAHYSAREGVSQMPDRTAQDGDSYNLRRKYVLAAIVVVVIVTTILHSTDRLTVFCDFTDVGLTMASLVIPVVMRLIAAYLEFSTTAANRFMFLVFALLFGLVARSTWVHNRSLPFFIMALMTKYSVVAVYLVAMAGTLFDGGPKQKHETQEEYEYRIKRTEEYNASLRAVATGFFVAYTCLVTRDRQFSSLTEYLQLDETADDADAVPTDYSRTDSKNLPTLLKSSPSCTENS